MISHISAAYVYPVVAAPIKNGVLAIDSTGVIQAIYTAQEAKEKQIKDIEYHDGILVPGFVNTHCHIELSNLRGKIQRHTGLPDFVKSVIKLRTSDEYELNLAILKADIEMYENGIVAVGDISNQLISRSLKISTPVYYHTFLEIMGFNPEVADDAMKRAEQFKQDFGALPVSIVPHAPYSVSPELFQALGEYAGAEKGPLTIHNQETADENAFFEEKTGDFLNLFKFLGQDVEFYQPSGKTSLQTYLPLLPKDVRTLLVHNTHTSAADVAFAEDIHPNLYWCLCPNANLYIEDMLPDVDMLRAADLKITLGTDSLASNDALSILSEMTLLQERFDVPVEELVKWGTFNGAEFLGIADRFGSFEPGKHPGINLLGFKEENGKVVLNNKIKRLF
ncbi:amidohydrolase family protein [Pedobacter nyackensis]|uniref:Cytosine/adenosine deaminase n=1 Tax=Pedobacter nyackensis TaxID=475255 RepID=A0A1W2C502_9SPHI|nr:amidohydrolase family protein [Pedobacter nyackensis]SMC79788.1 Cytosine/adenosine deaminase [Pedobacter nyackensis]